MKNKQTETDIVYDIMATMLRNSPEASYVRLNGALRSTLGNCIEADLPFKDTTVRRVYEELRGGWWFGDGAGSSTGERFYTLACECNHTGACLSFEAWAGRPPVLWETDCKTPSRLHVGAKLEWQGMALEVTSMREDSLVACAYAQPTERTGIKIGQTIRGEDRKDSYVVTEAAKAGKGWVLHIAAAPANTGSRTVSKRLVIKYAAIAEFRAEAKRRARAILDEIAKCDPEKDRESLSKEINAGHWRHWELEEIKAAFGKRQAWLKDQSAVEAWRAGKAGAWIHTKELYCRVKDGYVETSSGHRVSQGAVAALLPVVLARRGTAKSIGMSLPLDHHTLKSIGPKGVQIGCTLVPWSEVEYVDKQLKA